MPPAALTTISLMPFAAKERMLTSPTAEEGFSLAAGVAALEPHHGANALTGQKPHQGIVFENRSTRVGAMWVKCSGTHQVSQCCASGIVVGPTVYLYDGWSLIQEVDNTANVLARYAAEEGADRVLAQFRAGASSYYEQDSLFSVTSLRNSLGTLADTYAHDSFGRVTTSTGALTNSIQYSGRESDQETGLYQYRFRYYNQSGGRFISEDPLKFLRQQSNFYVYVGNNPINATDPLGLCKERCLKEANRGFIEGTRARSEFPKPDREFYWETGFGWALTGGHNEGAALGYLVWLLYHGGHDSIEYWKNWSDANQQYERDVKFCEAQ